MTEQQTHRCLISATMGNTPTTSLKESGDLLLIKLFEFDAPSLKPPAQISNQFDLLPAICSAVALLGDQSSETFSVRRQWANTFPLEVFGAWTKTIGHSCHSFLLV